MFKDDDLFISYTKEIDRSKKVIDLICSNDVYCIDGPYIIDILKGARKYSRYDILPIIEQIKDKYNWFKDSYPSDFERECGKWDVDEVFKEK